MIIIKIIIQYFIQITHTDDFPSTGTRLVYYKNHNNLWKMDMSVAKVSPLIKDLRCLENDKVNFLRENL